jgi:hypothetical protein
MIILDGNNNNDSNNDKMNIVKHNNLALPIPTVSEKRRPIKSIDSHGGSWPKLFLGLKNHKKTI